MQPTRDITTADLSLSGEGQDLWDVVLPFLPRAFADDEAPLLEALESAGRGAGVAQTVPVARLLDAYSRGSQRVGELLVRRGDAAADAETRRLQALEHAALTRLAVGYSAGLQDTIDRLRRLAEESSPVDAASGAVKPGEFAERLSLEVDRCRRMDLPLGVLRLALGGESLVWHGLGDAAASVAHQIGECLRENLRGYDSIGLTEDGAFVVVLPDISRHGLAGAAERLRLRLASCASGRQPDLTFALAHYDVVDVGGSEMLAALQRSMREAQERQLPLVWV